MAKSKKVKEALEPLGFPRSMVVKMLADAFGKKTAKKETNEFLTKTISTLGDEMDEDDLAALEEKDEESHGVAQDILEALGKGQPVLVIDDDEEEDERGADGEPEEQDEDETDDEDAEQEDEEVETEDDESDEESDDSEDDDDTEEEEDEEVEVKPVKKGAAKAAPPAKVEKKQAKPTGKPVPAKKGAAKITKLPEGKPKKGGAPRAKGKIFYIVKLLRQASAKKPITKARILAELVKKFGKDQEQGMMTTINSQINGQLKANRQMVIGNNGKKGEDRGFWIEDMGNYVMPE